MLLAQPSPGARPEPGEPGHGIQPDDSAGGGAEIDAQGFWGYFCERLFPRLYNSLRLRTLHTPIEYADITEYMRGRRAELEADILRGTETHLPLLPLRAQTVPGVPAAAGNGDDHFVHPIHQVIRRIVRPSEGGGDSATAELAMVNRESRMVRNLTRTLRRARDPLILLGDPGTGKSMTLRQVACAMMDRELHRVFPTLTLFVSLGDFHVQGSRAVSRHDVLDHVRTSIRGRLRRRLDALDRAGRLVILFDGMDEMSRERYTEHTQALSEFASSRRGRTKTLFSCRITDFSPRFTHRRLVLLPFDRGQIRLYLRRFFLASSITIDNEPWRISRLARRLVSPDSTLEANNPFVLWLLCHHLASKHRWPQSRIELLRGFLAETYRRKRNDEDSNRQNRRNADWTLAELSWDDCLAALAEFAFVITQRNRGRAISVTSLTAAAMRPNDVLRMVWAGCTLGVLDDSIETHEHQIRFDHHRLQEYFAALHVCRPDIDFDWRDKMDVPRWQETLVNVVLMGGGDAALDVLANTLHRAVGAWNAAWQRYEDATKQQGKRQAPADEDDPPRSTFSLMERLPFFDLLFDLVKWSRATSEKWRPVLRRYYNESVRRGLPANRAPAVSGDPELVKPDDRANAEAEQEPGAAAVRRERKVVEPRLSASRESRFGDRIELVARLCKAGGPTVRTKLLPALRGAVDFLTRRGNPISQVKVIRACVQVGDGELLSVARRPMESPIGWLRTQALILLAQAGPRLGVNLASEIALELARGTLVSRFPEYVSSARRSRQPATMSLAIGLVAALLPLVLFTMAAAKVYWGVHAWPAATSSTPAPNAAIFAAAVILGLGAGVVTRAKYISVLPIGATLWVLLVEILVERIPLLASLDPDTIRGETPPAWLQSLTMLPVLVIALLTVYYSAKPVLRNMTRLLSLAIYLIATRQARSTDSTFSVRSAIVATGVLGRYNEETIVAMVQAAALIVLVHDIDAASFSIPLSVVGLSGIVLLRVTMLMPVVILAVRVMVYVLSAMAHLLYDLHFISRTYIAIRRLRDPRFIRNILPTLMWVAAFFAVPMLFLILLYVLSGDEPAPTPLDPHSLWIPGVMLLIVVSGFVLVYTYVHRRKIRDWLRNAVLRLSDQLMLRAFPARALGPDRWKQVIRSSSPRRQAKMIARTDAQGLRITAAELLKLLAEVEPDIRKDPAASVYWQHRCELEQILKQERHG